MSSGTINSSITYRVLAVAKELIKKNYDIYIFALRFDKYSNFKDERISEINGIKIIRPWQIRCPVFELSLLSYIFSSIVYLLKINPDIIHIYKPNPVTIISLFMKLIKQVPIVLDTDDIDSEVMKIEKKSFLTVKLVKISEEISARYSNGIIGASKYLYNYYSSKYKNKIVTYIPNGADFAYFNDSQNNIKFGNKIVFVGNINRINILEPLFYSLKEMKEKNKYIKINTVIIGSGKYLNYFKNLSKKLKLTKNITFIGFIPQNKLYNYIKRGDIGYCFMPDELTIKACSSMKIFQYMQFGAVPIVSNVGDLPVYIFHGRAGYIAKAGSSSSLTNSLIKALSDKNERMKKIKYAVINAKKRYKWSILASKIEGVYKNLYDEFVI